MNFNKFALFIGFIMFAFAALSANAQQGSKFKFNTL